MGIVRAPNILAKALLPLGRAAQNIKVQPPVKQFSYFPVIPPEKQIDNTDEVKTLIQKINPDLKIEGDQKNWRSQVMSQFIEHLIKGCLRRPEINPRRIGYFEFKKLRERFSELGIRIEKLEMDWSSRPRVVELVPRLTEAFISSDLGKKELVIFVESSESAKIQIPIFDETQDVDLVDWKCLKPMSNLSEYFIEKYLHSYYQRRWSIASFSQKALLALLFLDYKGYEVVNWYFEAFGIEGVNPFTYLLVSKPAFAFLLSVNSGYFSNIHNYWNNAYQGALSCQRLAELFKYDLADKVGIVNALRFFKKDNDMGHLAPIFSMLSSAQKSEKPPEKLKEAMSSLVSVLKEYKEIKMFPKALEKYYFSISQKEKENFIKALWAMAAGIPSGPIGEATEKSDKIMIVNLSPTINLKWRFDAEGEEWFKPELTPSGRGVNVAIALRALGIDPLIMGVRGGELGEAYIELLKKIGLDAENFVKTADQTRLFHILSSPDEIVIDDPPMKLTKEEFKELRDKIVEKAKKDAIVVLSTGLPKGEFIRFSVEHSIKQLIDDLKAKGAKVYVDSRTDGLKAAYRAKADLIKCNRKEFAEFMDIKEKDSEDLEILAGAMKTLISHGIPMVIVTLGEKGALLATKDGVVHSFPPEVDAQNPVGSGDTFLGAFTKKISEGEIPLVAFQFATALATLSVSHPSTGIAMKFDREQLEDQVQKIINETEMSFIN